MKHITHLESTSTTYGVMVKTINGRLDGKEIYNIIRLCKNFKKNIPSKKKDNIKIKQIIKTEKPS